MGRKTACGPPQERQGTARNENFLKMRTEEALCFHLLTSSASHSKLNLHYFCVCARELCISRSIIYPPTLQRGISCALTVFLWLFFVIYSLSSGGPVAVEPRNRFSKHDQIREKVEKCAAEPPLDRRATFLRQRGAAQLTSFLSVRLHHCVFLWLIISDARKEQF